MNRLLGLGLASSGDHRLLGLGSKSAGRQQSTLCNNSRLLGLLLGLILGWGSTLSLGLLLLRLLLVLSLDLLLVLRRLSLGTTSSSVGSLGLLESLLEEVGVYRQLTLPKYPLSELAKRIASSSAVGSPSETSAETFQTHERSDPTLGASFMSAVT